ncbi:MAG TPA: 23S rRNA (guanosine(2251)-2'-O)-methyltransferase RlmB [Anaeromyxobacteraceae bacterium]|nr:23S rRNA (guanosine(2251)-2'-O)-methyltransferase RlmB [Anaeromyxobacteraceae bacterium]
MRAVHGVNPVRELLRSAAEPPAELWVAEGAQQGRLSEILRMARQRGAKVREAPRQKLDRLAGTDRHQGVVAVVADYRYRDLEDLLGAARERGEPPLLVVLDGVEDPHNVGAVVRSAHALGAHGIVIPRDRAAGITPAAAKASAGAVEHCPVARVTNVAQALEGLKESGVWTVATAADAEADLGAVDLAGPVAIVLGGEGRGIRPLVRKTCDLAARIPMAGGVGSLNVSAAAAICLYEALRQRRLRKGS